MNTSIRVLDTYDVFVGTGILSQLNNLVDLKKYSSLFLVTDEVIEKHWSFKINEAFPSFAGKVSLQPGETSKNIESVEKVWEEMLKSGCDRKTLVVNLGGGVIGDLGGFAASTFMRGVDFIQIPTTLTSQVDASVGGKLAIDFAGVKNLVGVFTQPLAVICDTQFLSTLSEREFISGFGEIIKHGLIADKEYFEFVTSKKPKDFSPKELEEIVLRSIKIKANIVNEDEKELGSRKLLNFGHTIGHALESLSLDSRSPLLHGEAISLGIVAESKLSQLNTLISTEDLKKIRSSLENAGLPVNSTETDINKVLEKIKSDKKNNKGVVNFTLLKEIGKAVFNQTATEENILKTLEFIG